MAHRSPRRTKRLSLFDKMTNIVGGALDIPRRSTKDRPLPRAPVTHERPTSTARGINAPSHPHTHARSQKEERQKAIPGGPGVGRISPNKRLPQKSGVEVSQNRIKDQTPPNSKHTSVNVGRRKFTKDLQENAFGEHGPSHIRRINDLQRAKGCVPVPVPIPTPAHAPVYTKGHARKESPSFESSADGERRHVRLASADLDNPEGNSFSSVSDGSLLQSKVPLFELTFRESTEVTLALSDAPYEMGEMHEHGFLDSDPEDEYMDVSSYDPNEEGSSQCDDSPDEPMHVRFGVPLLTMLSSDRSLQRVLTAEHEGSDEPNDELSASSTPTAPTDEQPGIILTAAEMLGGHNPGSGFLRYYLKVQEHFFDKRTLCTRINFLDNRALLCALVDRSLQRVLTAEHEGSDEPNDEPSVSSTPTAPTDEQPGIILTAAEMLGGHNPGSGFLRYYLKVQEHLLDARAVGRTYCVIEYAECRRLGKYYAHFPKPSTSNFLVNAFRDQGYYVEWLQCDEHRDVDGHKLFIDWTPHNAHHIRV